MMERHKPHVRLDAEGRILRIGWPTIVEYRTADGRLHPWMPSGRHHVVVHDLPAYDQLARSGELYAPLHTGRNANARIIDERSAPGA